MEKSNQYVAPDVCVVECLVEKGYALSGVEDPMTIGIGDEVETASTKNWWYNGK
ncbi:MAG: hypothetical protein IJX44_07645 [Bacteroidaceae bacterium]|nr:hypothetical protein [Bacteroidaceae bacterium]